MKALAVSLSIACLLLLAWLFMDYEPALVFTASFLVEGFLIGSACFVWHAVRAGRKPDKKRAFVIMLNDMVMGVSFSLNGARKAMSILAHEHYDMNKWCLAGRTPMDLFTYEYYMANAGCYWRVNEATIY